MLRILRLLLGLAVALCANAASLAVENPYGGVAVTVTTELRLTVDGRSNDDFVATRDLDIVRNGDDVRLSVKPRDTPLDLVVQLPLGFSLEAQTVDGSISVEGFIHLVRLGTDTGAVRLSIPLRGTRLTLDADVPPPDFANPDRKLFRVSELELAQGRTLWRLRDRMDEREVGYGDYRIKTRAPSSVELLPFETPPNWPLRFHWEAADELEKMLSPAQPTGPASALTEPTALNAVVDDLIFRSDVRMVHLAMAVSTAEGYPATDLTAADFHVFEAGAEQRIDSVQAGDAAFNLVVLIDMSGSTAPDLRHMQAAARRFVDMARPGDRVAIYALSQSMFQVVSPLTSNREELLAAVQNLPAVAGASPVYDALLLSYAQELRQLPGERNALIVISDGLDNQITDQEAPSSVKFRHLKRAAEEMNAIVYPVFLLSGQRFGRGWSNRAEERMRELAEASGGRLFPAESISDLDPVFPLIEADLRSVYSLEYYPANQEFDGSWRSVEISVDKPDLSIRTRPGYYAN